MAQSREEELQRKRMQLENIRCVENKSEKEEDNRRYVENPDHRRRDAPSGSDVSDKNPKAKRRNFFQWIKDNPGKSLAIGFAVASAGAAFPPFGAAVVLGAATVASVYVTYKVCQYIGKGIKNLGKRVFGSKKGGSDITTGKENIVENSQAQNASQVQNRGQQVQNDQARGSNITQDIPSSAHLVDNARDQTRGDGIAVISSTPGGSNMQALMKPQEQTRYPTFVPVRPGGLGGSGRRQSGNNSTLAAPTMK